MKKVLLIIVGLIIAGGLFYGGVAYGKAHPASRTGGARSGFATGTARTGTAGFSRTGATATGGTGGGTSGTILSLNGQTLTISLSSGSSQIVILGSSTPILETSQEPQSALSVGQSVTISGTANSDGSLNAQSIQIRPAGMASSTSAR